MSSPHRFPSNPQQLDKIFSRIGAETPADQSNFSIELFDSFVKFVKKDVSKTTWHPTEQELRALASSVVAFTTKSPEFHEEPHITWFGEYGCALVGIQNAVGQVQLQLIGLDEWSFDVHSGPTSRTYSAQAGRDASKYISIGTIEAERYELFLRVVMRLLEKGKELKAEKRSAGSNKQGHQKTPTMIKSVLVDALALALAGDEGKESEPSTAPRGGFTDVGLRTGGNSRNTSWPLVRAVLQAILESAERHSFYRMAMAQFLLWCVEGSVARAASETERIAEVDADAIMQMLQEAVQEGAALADEEIDMAGFEERCMKARLELERAVRTQAERDAKSFALTDMAIGNVPCREQHLTPPVEPIPPATGKGDVQHLRALASTNLGWLPAPLSASDTWDDLSQWLDHERLQPGQGDAAMLLVINTVESFFFEQARRIESYAMSSSENFDLSVIEAIVDIYRKAVSAVRASPAGAALLSVEICSRELLVVWVAFSIVHAVTKVKEPLLAKYSVALHWADLRHLVLSHKLAVDAVQYVAAYLRANSAKPKMPVFSLRASDATIDLARRHAMDASVTIKMWEAEEIEATGRKERHWDEVLRKQQSLRELDRELLKLKVEREKKQMEFTQDNWCEKTRSIRIKLEAIKTELQEIITKISAVEAKIARDERPPPPIMQPLPDNKFNAMPILFFLQMPAHFQVLSCLSFTAQQMLLPSPAESEVHLPTVCDAVQREIDVSELIKADGPTTVWRDYYLHSSTARLYGVQHPRLVLGSNKEAISGEWYPKNVRQYYGPSNGVWYPDSLIPQLFWDGGLDDRNNTYFNPFLLDDSPAVVHRFTEKLPEKTLQWAMEQHGTATDPARGNWPEAAQDKKPQWLSSKPQYLAFGALRAYQNQQLRKLCVALRERSLPLDNPSVHVLLRQTLFHVGDLSNEDTPRPLWRTDMVDHDGWAVLRTELEGLVEDLRYKLRDHPAVGILGELAAVASQWDPQSRQVARDFAAIARQWADAVSTELEAAVTNNHIPELRARRCIFSMYAIVCHSAGELSLPDVQSLTEAVLLADYSRLFEDPTTYELQVRQLTTVSYAVLARRLPELLRALDDHPELLTSAVGLVLETTPPQLDWNRLVDSHGKLTQSYEAVSPAGNLYSINMQTGVVLFDGLPPRRLPASILQMPLYQRSFAGRNFEVVTNAQGVFVSTRPVLGRFYEFFLGSRGQLVVREIDPDRLKEPLELLDGTEEGVMEWGSELPIRLRHMHSHWVCRSKALILLRRPFFNEREVSFLLVLKDEGGGVEEVEVEEREEGDLTGHWTCYRVLEHQAGLSLPALLLLSSASLDELVLLTNPLDSRILHILGKFETDAGLVHTLYAAKSRALIFELPRYDLSFELREDRRLWSNNFRGFYLSAQQQLHDTLQGFQQYLVLESATDRRRVVVPAGLICKSGGGNSQRASVSGSTACDADRKLHVYEVHPRFNNLEVAAGPLAIEARLQLASLYAATDTALPDLRSQQTGGEVAVELLRQSWVNRPLTKGEYGHLTSIARFSQFTPALALLCYELDASAREVSFLHTDRSSQPPLVMDDDAATEYQLRKQNARLNSRAVLTGEEEARVLGFKVEERPRGRIPPTVGSLELSGETTEIRHRCTSQISAIEDRLKGLIRLEEQTERAPLPLDLSDLKDTEIGRTLTTELEVSWTAHQSIPVAVIEPFKTLKKTITQLLSDASSVRLELEEALLKEVARVPRDVGWHASVCNMRRAANLVPTVTPRDLARAAWQPDELRRFNFFLSEAAVQTLHADTLVWLQLCVLEDKLERMRGLAVQMNAQELERELQEVGRKWSVEEHPQWLVFEVEQQLQIRNVQYSTARDLMDNPGQITQLNMGEGKTRVILPMLVLCLASRSADRLMRLHFLSALMGEAYDYLHRTLTASLMHRRMCMLPFHRNVKLSHMDARKMYDSLLRCKAAGGAVCVTPEHRLSLQLKWHELRQDKPPGSDEICSTLAKIDEDVPYFDVLDESDEVLRHNYQLIYAVGSSQLLPDGKERWVAAQALLKQLQTNPTVAHILQQPDVARRLPTQSQRGAGAFDDLRLLAGDALEKHRPSLLRALVEGVIDDPPYHMRWLTKYQQNHGMRETIITFVTQPGVNIEWFEGQPEVHSINELQRQELLALRGLLTYDLLVHCLCRRHRVDYGVDLRRGIDRRVAVPYRASDTPSERAEYAQPETLIVLTLLSYYRTGLTREQVKEALRTLLSLGPMAQQAEYGLWVDSARPTWSSEQLTALDNVDKLDLSNEQQLTMLHLAYRYNMAAAEYWLDACVFPRETMQFPHRFVCNAFHLADNSRGQAVGFSGTKDNSLTTPLQMKLGKPTELSMLATDGKMLSLVGRENGQVKCFDSSKPFRDAVLEFAVEKGAAALIDAGAAMAGLSNREVAENVLALFPQSSWYEGVVYFEISENAWFVLSRRGRSWPLASSPIHESAAFVYFDESRCRGHDKRLKPDATAVLTIGPGMCKDKIMQAAGRLRKLMYKQKLMFAVPSELVSKIQAANPLLQLQTNPIMQPLHILHWVMRNTVQAVKEGLPGFGAQGSHFATTRHPDARLMAERVELSDLYAESITEQTVCQAILKQQGRDMTRVEELKIKVNESALSMVTLISEHAQRYGSDVHVASTGLDEECERELENERELEREVERQVPRQAPKTPQAWPFAAVLEATSPLSLPASAGVMPLAEAVEKYLSSAPKLLAIDWAQCGIFVTRNFFETVSTREGGVVAEFSDYLRPVDVVLLFFDDDTPNRPQCLLLSEWEADKVLDLLWRKNDSTYRGHCCLVNMAYLRSFQGAAEAEQPAPPLPSLCVPKMINLPALSPHTPQWTSMLVGLELLAGGTSFPTAEHKMALESLLPTSEAKRGVLGLVAMVGRQHYIPRSDLEAICAVDIGES